MTKDEFFFKIFKIFVRLLEDAIKVSLVITGPVKALTEPPLKLKWEAEQKQMKN